MSHTPGPWMVGEYQKGQYACEVTTQAVGPRSGKPVVVARIASGQRTREDDARLIAAAPDLLAALQELLPIAESLADATSVRRHERAAIQAAAKAIAQATGADK